MLLAGKSSSDSIASISNKLGGKKAVLDVLKDAVKDGVSSEQIYYAFVKKYLKTYADVINNSNKYKENIQEFAAGGEWWLLQNIYLNWLRVIGIIDGVDYDFLHRNGIYEFSEKESYNKFVQNVCNYRNGVNNDVPIVQGKNILEIGPGSGMDAKYMLGEGANSVQFVDGSDLIVNRILPRTKKSLSTDVQTKMILPEAPTDMLTGLNKKGAFDLIYTHSTTHYGDDDQLKKLKNKIIFCLKDGGYLAMAVKTPGAMFDKKESGICLINDSEPDPSMIGEYVRQRFWYNYDTMTRCFRNGRTVNHIMEADLTAADKIMSHGAKRNKKYLLQCLDRTTSLVEGYESEHQKGQYFNYFIFKKVLNPNYYEAGEK